jgi:hypothetical protein
MIQALALALTMLPQIAPQVLDAPKTSPAPRQTPRADSLLLDDIQRRACLFFAEKTDSRSGLTHDRARLDGSDDYQIASIAATGYALAALPIAVEHKWTTKSVAAEQARRSLKTLISMPNERGWMFHFVNAADGSRAWNSEVSTMDTALLVLGALACGEYFRATSPEIARDANQLYTRMDWNWVRTNGGKSPEQQVLAHGWKPRSGFLRYNYEAYSEAILLVLLGLGAEKNPLPASTWDALQRETQSLEGVESLKAGPIFIHQMPHGFVPLQNRRDRLGWDYWVSSSNAMRIHQRFCAANTSKRTTYARGFWGLNAGDGPRGYTAYGAPDGPEDGTVSLTGAIASAAFDAASANEIAHKMKRELGAKIWGRYGFANAFNIGKNWFDSDVIGIDLGMALLAIENQRSGLIWKLMQRQAWLGRAYKSAGIRITREVEPRKLKK